MNEEKRRGHAFAVRERTAMEITGVKEVVSFDDRSVVLDTEQGDLSVEGESLRIGTLDVERGEVKLSGRIDGVYYYNVDGDGEEKQSFFHKLFH